MLVFELKLKGIKTFDNIEPIKNSKCTILLSEWNLANIIRILKTRNQTLYKQINKLYDDASEIGW